MYVTHTLTHSLTHNHDELNEMTDVRWVGYGIVSYRTREASSSFTRRKQPFTSKLSNNSTNSFNELLLVLLVMTNTILHNLESKYNACMPYAESNTRVWAINQCDGVEHGC